MLKNTNRPSMITETEVATLLGLSRETLRRRRFKNEPPRFYKIGKRVLYDEQDIMNFMKSCLQEPVTEAEQKDGENEENIV